MCAFRSTRPPCCGHVVVDVRRRHVGFHALVFFPAFQQPREAVAPFEEPSKLVSTSGTATSSSA
jgi:hypothetical protein